MEERVMGAQRPFKLHDHRIALLGTIGDSGLRQEATSYKTMPYQVVRTS